MYAVQRKKRLSTPGLDIQNCCGQGYDNGANMVGINSRVKTLILNINPRECSSHSWNLLLVVAANSSVATKCFWFYAEDFLKTFLSSRKRWKSIKDKLKLTIKPLSDKRWESRIEVVKGALL
ncbi:52 kDa repressor of the inhibitor of the protein kinase [Trichonephila clavipes]|nr:52 kDa repressor of the inhibitor of the protein kinase [Trichonephila clavipes]